MPPAYAMPPMFAVGSTMIIEKDGTNRAAVMAAAIPPGVDVYIAISYASQRT